MGKRFTPTHEADKRAIDLHLQLREIEQLPGVDVDFSDDHKTIYLADKNKRMMFSQLNVDTVLLLDVQRAKAAGGTYRALLDSRRRPSTRVSEVDVARGVQEFFNDD